MNVIAFNGSPRKNKNTATLLDHALKGAAAAGAQTRLVHLYDFDFQGCHSCFACKRKGSKSHGVCALRDDLTPLLAAVRESDALLLGSPLYFGQETGVMRSFMERLLFPCLVYDEALSTLFPRRIKTALVYTMNIPEKLMHDYGKDKEMERMAGYMERIFGQCELFFSTDTLQFDNYSQYEASRFDAAAKEERHKTVFPQDCQQAFELGQRLIKA